MKRKIVNTILTASLLLLVLAGSPHLFAKEIAVSSPNSNAQFILSLFDNTRLAFDLTFRNAPVIERSPIGITVENIDLGQDVEIGNAELYKIDETYLWRGVHSRATNRCNGAKISITHKKSKTHYTLDVRVFDDGIAFRLIIPGEGSRVVQGEATKFVLPAGSVVWHHDFYMPTKASIRNPTLRASRPANGWRHQ